MKVPIDNSSSNRLLQHRSIGESCEVERTVSSVLPLWSLGCTPPFSLRTSPLPGPFHVCGEAPDVLPFHFPSLLVCSRRVTSSYVRLRLATPTFEGAFGRRCAGSHKLGCEVHSCLMHGHAKIDCCSVSTRAPPLFPRRPPSSSAASVNECACPHPTRYLKISRGCFRISATLLRDSRTFYV